MAGGASRSRSTSAPERRGDQSRAEGNRGCAPERVPALAPARSADQHEATAVVEHLELPARVAPHGLFPRRCAAHVETSKTGGCDDRRRPGEPRLRQHQIPEHGKAGKRLDVRNAGATGSSITSPEDGIRRRSTPRRPASDNSCSDVSLSRPSSLEKSQSWNTSFDSPSLRASDERDVMAVLNRSASRIDR